MEPRTSGRLWRAGQAWRTLGVLALLSVAPTAALAADPPAEAPPASAGLAIVHARLFDGRNPGLRDDVTIVIRGNHIESVGRTAAPADLPRLDAGGRVVIPGLIDAHAHPMLALGTSALRDADPGYVQLRAAAEARRMLYRGFTTVRDTGGPAFGLQRAIDEGLVEGPRIFPSGAIISQTGGHGDMRPRIAPTRRSSGENDALERLGYTLVADGPDEVLAAAREQLRLGATQIKLAAGGGISSSLDPIDSVQYSAAELRAAVEAAADWGTYVTVHAYTPEAIRRSIEAGVKCIEHGHLIDEPTMKLLAERGVFLSPQAFLFGGGYASIAPKAASSAGADATAPASPAASAMRAKAAAVSAGLDRMMLLARKYRVKVAFGGDFFGAPALYAAQSKEFGARLKWFSSTEVLQQATGINGDLLALSGARNPYGRVGVIEPGALADLLVVEGNPLEDVRLLEDPQRNLRVIVKDGRIIRNSL